MDNREKIILTIQWSMDDLLSALQDAGIEPNEKNIQKLLDPEHRLLRSLEEGSIELGWCRIDGLISNVFGDI